MSSQEIGLGEWEKRIQPLNYPAVSLDLRRSMPLLFAGFAYLVIGLLIPQKFAIRPRPLPLDISRQTAVLEKQIETLSGEAIITEERVLELEETIREIERNASGDDPVKTWEALDHLRQGLKREAEEFAAFALGQTETLAQNEALAEALAESGSELDGDLLTAAMEHLAAQVSANEAMSEALGRLAPELLEKLQTGELTAEELGKLAEVLKLNKEQLAQCMGRLCELRMVDLKDLRLCEQLGQCRMEGLAAYLNANCKGGSCMSVEAAIAHLCRKGGRGGITRGRGDAPMAFTEASTMEGTAFKEQVLPPSGLAALKDSQRIGVSIGTPSTEAAGESYGAGVLEPSAAGSGEAATLRLLPRHRRAVERYFERK